MLCCSQHWSPPPLPCIASPACTDSSKALSISRWAVATSVHAANTIQRRLFYHAWRQLFGEIQLHGRWLPAEQLRLNMHMKCNIGNDIAFTLSSMMRVINKVLPSVDSEPNTMEIAGSLPLQIYRYTYQLRTRRYFFWVTTKVRETPTVPSQKYASAWEQDSVLTRLAAIS